MLPRRSRLLLRAERSFFQTARRRSSEHFQCLYRLHEAPLQIAVLVSKKVAIKATKRNVVKRKVRFAVQQVLPEFTSCRAQVVCIVKRSMVELSQEETQEVVRNTFKMICR